MITLDTDIKYIKGIGTNRAELFNKAGIYTVNDLLTYFPRDYEDRTSFKNIHTATDGENCLIKATAMTKVNTKYIRRGLSVHNVAIGDDTGTAMVTWFNQDYLKKLLIQGDTYYFYGKINKHFGRCQIETPLIALEDDFDMISGIIPIYSLIAKLNQGNFRNSIKNALKEIQFDEILGESIIEKYGLCSYNYAMNQIHFPDTLESAYKARDYLIFQELLLFQLALKLIKQNNTINKGTKFNVNIDTKEFLNLLPFSLTEAQNRVIEELKRDMGTSKIMNRLVQGDVGSGKTVVAAIAMFIAVKNGYQATLMAPTTILATQHYNDLKPYFDALGITVEVLTSSTKKKDKIAMLERLKSKDIDILFGTHSIIQDAVEFNKLGLVVTDEQHRFGVNQRVRLSNKGNYPDTLVMTATPIPRTLALIVYGDLDISIIDELPKGRKEIKTYAVTHKMDYRINEFIKKEVTSGRQAYVICPLVDENDELDLKSVTELAKNYMNDVFVDFNVGYIHGKMKSKEKDDIMKRFKDREIQILVSTTVIEVGINVPNSTIMVIENSERFGLSQLHQLRGRVGRGEHQSYCILKYKGQSQDIKSRMKIMEESNDGFKISEKDLELRGPGDFFGIRQHGLPVFKIANLLRDVKLLEKTQKLAEEIMVKDRYLESEENKKTRERIKIDFSERIENIGT